jgi:hypothetical protein
MVSFSMKEKSGMHLLALERQERLPGLAAGLELEPERATEVPARSGIVAQRRKRGGVRGDGAHQIVGISEVADVLVNHY